MAYCATTASLVLSYYSMRSPVLTNRVRHYQSALGTRYLARVSAEHRAFLAKEFASVVRADGPLAYRPTD
eukprot:2198823-Rhodomonas_salina.1